MNKETEVRACRGGESAADPMAINPPVPGETVEFRGRLRFVSSDEDPYGTQRLREAKRLLAGLGIQLTDLRYAVPAGSLPNPRTRRSIVEAERLRQTCADQKRQQAAIMSRVRLRPDSDASEDPRGW